MDRQPSSVRQIIGLGEIKIGLEGLKRDEQQKLERTDQTRNQVAWNLHRNRAAEAANLLIQIHLIEAKGDLEAYTDQIAEIRVRFYDLWSNPKSEGKHRDDTSVNSQVG